MARYRIEIADAQAHRFHVTLTLARPAPQQRFSLPVWIPGSYMVREFGRHLSSLRAQQGRREVALTQIDKTTWEAACEGRTALRLSWLVYANDASVRAAFLDGRRGFFNGTSVFLRAEGREHEPQQLQIGPLPAGWELATALKPAGGEREFVAADYAELVDHPVELGAFWRGRFDACGVPHEFVVAGAWPSFDGERLLADARRLCEAQIRFWHGGARPPFDRYAFLLNAVDEGYGGLEHRNSTALIAARRDLPRRGVADAGEGYQTLLGLISHEYFHTWNVKRLQPREFAAIDLGRENYTQLLWFFEGFTSYYDDLLLHRCGLLDAPRYLRALAKSATALAGTPGRQVQSVAQASFDAWVKYYRADENTPNATVSYYAKGSLVALCLDLTLREKGKGSLDDVMRGLWQRSGGGAIDESDIAAVLQQVAGRSLRAELEAWVHGTDELPVPALLARFGVETRVEAATLPAQLGLRLAEAALSGVQVRQVLRGSAAERAGLAAGDELLAVDGWRIRRLDDARQWLAEGRPFELLAVRDQRVLTLCVEWPAVPAAPALAFVPADKPGRAALARRRAWLGS